MTYAQASGMRSLGWSAAAWTLYVLAVLTVCLSLVPLLYPIVATLGLVVMVGALLVLLLHPVERAAGERRISRSFIDHYPATRRSLRALRLAFFGGVLVFLLYGLFTAHSYACYLGPLNQELDPLRDAFRRESGFTENRAPETNASGGLAD